MGSSLRLPIDMKTSTKTDPVVTITEIPDGKDRSLNVLYYDVNQKALVIMPGQTGEGKIRVADTATNSFHDICYKVEGEGVGLNIFDDNGIFSWYDAKGRGEEIGHDAWQFVSAMTWPGLTEAPQRNDLAIGSKGESFTFRTLADSIDLHFMGSTPAERAVIEVYSNLPGFNPISSGEPQAMTYTSQDGTKPVRIQFNNPDSVAHMVTVKVASDAVRFDSMVETFAPSITDQLKSDPTAPGIYWSRTLPATASLKETKDSILPLTVYFTDIGGLAAVSMNNKDISSRLVKSGDELWSLKLDPTKNGSYRFVVTDTAGNTTTRDLIVDWFSVKPVKADPGAPEIQLQLTDVNGKPIDEKVPADFQIMLEVTDKEKKVIAADLAHYQYENPTEKDPGSQSFASYNAKADPETGRYPAGGSGIYRAAVRDEKTGIVSYRFVNLNQRSAAAPIVSLVKSADGKKLVYQAEKVADESGELNPLVKVTLNDLQLFGGEESTFRVEGTLPLTHGGTYVLTAEDAAGVSASVELNVAGMPVLVPADAVTLTKVTESQTGEHDRDGNPIYTSNQDGKIVVDIDKVTGGLYNAEATKAKGEISGSYEFALLKVTGEKLPEPGEKTQWTAKPSFNGLDLGEYVLYARDAADHKLMTAPMALDMEYVRIIIQNVSTALLPPYQRYSNVITVTATGGYGEMEYSIYNLSMQKSGNLVIKDQGTPEDDSDDMVEEDRGFAGKVTRPLWQKENILEQAGPGKYLIRVRDSEHPENCAELEVRTKHSSGHDHSGSAAVIVPQQPEHGTITQKPAWAEEGQTVTVTVKADPGYVVQDVIVKDQKGNEISVKRQANGTYTFEMPEGSVAVSAVIGSVFTDVPADAYFADAVGWAIASNVTKGYTETTFGPNEGCTRAQAVTFLWRAAGCPKPAGNGQRFTDVPADAYYADAVQWAVENGVTLGTTGTTFSPNQVCTRAQIVTFLWRLEKSPAMDPNTPFTDVPPDVYYAEAVTWAVENGITKGRTDTIFDGDMQCTRAHIITFLWRQFN